MAGRKPKGAPALAQGLATLKESLEMGSIGSLVKSVDILPNEAYDHIVRLSKLTADPNAMVRFLDYPGVMKIVAHPRIQAILQDPELVAASEKQDYAALLRNTTLMQAVSDPRCRSSSWASTCKKRSITQCLPIKVPPLLNPNHD